MAETDKVRELTEEELRAYWSALTLPEDMAEATDFIAEEAIKLDLSIKLPEFFSLWEWIYETSNQWAIGSCTAMWTSHATQILNVKKWWIKPTNSNILTPDWKDLWSKMWHSTTKYDGWDYVEKAVSTALKEWILVKEDGSLAKFDGYAYGEWERKNNYNDSIDMMKRYIYNWNPIVWCVRWAKVTWNEMSAGEVKTSDYSATGWHCIALVGWDANGFWFINSRSPNDANKRKSRFYISFDVMRKLDSKFNYRYRVLYIKQDAKKDPEYLKRKNSALLVLQALKKTYNSEPADVQNAIVVLSNSLRKAYPEINTELPK